MIKKHRLWSSLLIVAAMIPAGTAWADSIDGTWCAQNGRSLSIEGSNLALGTGERLPGDYAGNPPIFNGVGQNDVCAAI